MDSGQNDHDLLVEIHALLDHHLQDFRNHTSLDDRREQEGQTLQREIAARLLGLEKGYAKLTVIGAIGIIAVQIFIHFLK